MAMLQEVRAISSAINRDCAHARSEVDRWADGMKENINSVEAQHVEVMRECRDAVPPLEAEKLAIEQSSATASKELAEQDSECAAIAAEAAALKAQLTALPAELDTLTRLESEAKAALESERSALTDAEAQGAHESRELTKGVVFYKKLGLEFHRMGDDRLKLIFTMVDAASPEREFSFDVYVNGEDVYEVEQCEPAVPTLPELLAKVNADNDFSAFVRAMRQQFKALAR
jgi:hypothetical protein